MSGAMTLAEGDKRFKVDASLIFGGNTRLKKFILRTSFDSLSVWKAKYVKVNTSPFQAFVKTVVKEAAVIDGEVWVFGVDSTNSQDIVTAVEVAMKVYKVKASDIISDVYVKNLNTENEKGMEDHARIKANKSLYKKTCIALKEAAQKLQVKGALNLWVFSSNLNHKIPKEELHDALRSGGTSNVKTDDHIYDIWSGSNDGIRQQRFKTNLHLATLTI